MHEPIRENTIEKFTGKLEKEDSGFTMMLNDTLQNIKNIDALGIYSYLSTKPQQWLINTKEISRHFDIGPKKVRAAFNYLIEIGLLERVRDRSHGKLVGCSYFLRIRINLPRGQNGSVDEESPRSQKPRGQNGSPYKTEILKNKESNSTPEGEKPKTPDGVLLLAFALFKKYGIKTPNNLSEASSNYLAKGISMIGDIDNYLSYLRDRCSGWLDAVYVDYKGRERINDFRVVLQPKIIKQVMAGEFEDKE